MDKTLIYLIIFSLIGGLLSLIGGLILSAGNKKSVDKFSKLAVPFAAGSLLAAVFLDLLKEGIEASEVSTVLISALIGMVGFFILERVTSWFHHHHEEDGKNQSRKSTILVVVADTIHNALDGVVIAAGFLISIPTGIVTAFAVAAHEIPQEIGDFGILLSRGMSRKRVVVINVLSSLSTTALALIVFIIGDANSLPLGALFGLSAGFLLYVAASDLIPTIHQKKSEKGAVDTSIVMLLLGVLVVAGAIEISHRYIKHGHEHDASNDTHQSEAHADYVVLEGAPQPSILVMADKGESGLTVHVIADNFRFTPQNEGGENVMGEGHAHLYVGGKKITRLYGEWTFIPAGLLPDVYEEVMVSLSSNDHSEYHYADGRSVSAVASVEHGDEDHSDEHTERDDDGHDSVDKR